MASHGVARPATIVPRTEQERIEEEREIKQYRELEDLIRSKIAERQYTVEVLELTSKLLKKNPEYYTIWNVRRRLLIYGLFSKPLDSSSHSTESQNISQTDIPTTSSAKPFSSSSISSEASSTTPQNPASQSHGKNGTTLDIIKADLDFLFPLMMKYPKCYWLWNYRLWLLQEGNQRLGAEFAQELWSRELILVGKMLVKDSRNFHGWGYRRTVVSQLESPKLNGKSMVEAEFEYTTKMIHGDKGLSNFSAWHRRSKLIPRLLDERHANDATRRKFLDDEFDLIISAMYTDSYPYAQSAWFYYQFLMTTLTDYIGHATITPNFTTLDRSEYVIRQLAILKDMLDGAEDCKWIYSALIEYTLALCQMEEREPDIDEKQDCKAWLAELRKLDPLRSGRWADLDNSLRK
ncbi:geranylgeranyl transferase-like protein type II alpha subunit [Mollisia scopiformis]|uniref:Geranylgeranyl transferase type-2 subunit alpha n=1 Tax=Mollisia scopiformis TaxID=149040 RepID=A0A194X0V2_MOLSC|nr:geranylgeranyl transferase-like protein type II alpha subunit [Mollisia scopiformis]KUJ13492.1 geranylgeranyl transferas-like protein type II alpha subunit [Mollisia scopiformis]